MEAVARRVDEMTRGVDGGGSAGDGLWTPYAGAGGGPVDPQLLDIGAGLC